MTWQSLCWKHIIRNKKNWYYLFFFSFFTLLILIAFTFYQNFVYYIENTITKNIGFRTLSISPDLNQEDYGLRTIQELDYIVDVHSALYDTVSVVSSFKNDQFDGSIDLVYGNAPVLPQVVLGRTLSSNSFGEAICPVNFYPSSLAYGFVLNKEKMLQGSDLLNTNFQVEYYSYKFDGDKMVHNENFSKEFKIVGLYDSDTVMNPANVCYVSENDIIDMANDSNSNDDSVVYGFIALVDDLSHVDEVIEQLEQLGFYGTNIRNEIDFSSVNLILLVCRLVVALLLTFLFFLTVFFVRKKIVSDARYLSLLRASGFSKINLIKMYLQEIILISVLAFLIGCVLFCLLYFCFIVFLGPKVYTTFHLQLFFLPYALTFGVLFIVNIGVTLFLLLRQLKNEIVMDLRGGL